MTDSRRAAVVAEAEDWIGTPFHHAARVKGAGVDCLMLLAEVYERAGVASHVEPPFYVPDWHMHRDAERYLEGLLGYAREIEGPPLLVHAYWAVGVVWGDARLFPLRDRLTRFFSPFVHHEILRP